MTPKAITMLGSLFDGRLHACCSPRTPARCPGSRGCLCLTGQPVVVRRLRTLVMVQRRGNVIAAVLEITFGPHAMRLTAF